MRCCEGMELAWRGFASAMEWLACVLGLRHCVSEGNDSEHDNERKSPGSSLGWSVGDGPLAYKGNLIFGSALMLHKGTLFYVDIIECSGKLIAFK